jgi:hypothetical protein
MSRMLSLTSSIVLLFALTCQVAFGATYDLKILRYKSNDCTGPVVQTSYQPNTELVCYSPLLDVMINGRQTLATRVQYNCPANTMNWGTSRDCDHAAVPMASVCLTAPPPSTGSTRTLCAPRICKPAAGLKRSRCNALIAQCTARSRYMKW